MHDLDRRLEPGCRTSRQSLSDSEEPGHFGATGLVPTKAGTDLSATSDYSGASRIFRDVAEVQVEDGKSPAEFGRLGPDVNSAAQKVPRNEVSKVSICLGKIIHLQHSQLYRLHLNIL